MRSKRVLKRIVSVISLGALAMEMLLLFANVGYRVYLANSYHWKRYVNHVDAGFFREMLVCYGVSLVTAFVLTMSSGPKGKTTTRALTAINTLLIVTLIALWTGKYLVTYEQFIGHERGW